MSGEWSGISQGIYNICLEIYTIEKYFFIRSCHAECLTIGFQEFSLGLFC